MKTKIVPYQRMFGHKTWIWRIQRRPTLIPLLLVFLMAVVSTAFWTLSDRTPPSWDPSDHIRTALDYYQPMAHGEFTQELREIFTNPHPYAPLFHLFTAAGFLLFGTSRLTFIAVNFAALGILLVSVSWITRTLNPAHKAAGPAVIASLLAVCYHYPAWMIHDAFLDYTLMAMVALGFVYLLKADQFHVRADAVWFGIAAGLGMWTKQTFPFFFILPGVWLLWRAAVRRDRRAISNMILSLAVALLIASIWYVPHLDDIRGIYRVNSSNASLENDAPVFSLKSFAYYGAILLDVQLQMPLAVVFIAGAAWSLYRRFREHRILYLWILGGIASFTLLANKDPRYTLPILPAVAMLSVSWLNSLKRNRTLVGTTMVSLALMSFFNAQWPSQWRDLRAAIAGHPIYILAGNIVHFDHRPLEDDWSIPKIVRLAAAAPGSRLGVVPNVLQLNPSNVALSAKLQGTSTVEWLTRDDARTRALQEDFVLARTRLDHADHVAPVEIEMDEYLRSHPEQFKPAAIFPLPDSQQVILYRRE